MGKRKAWRNRYHLMMREGRGGCVELISNTAGRTPYMRVEADDGVYVGSMSGRPLVLMAQAILRAYRPTKRPRRKS